jgi:DNA-binding response OmpR family regulator
MTTAPKRVIVVMDDSDIVLETLHVVLGASGFEVRTASTLDQLERQRASCKPDLFVLDVQMPEAFGDDIGQLLRDVRGVGVPILLFSSLHEEALARRASEAGLTGYVPKAAGVPALVGRIKELLDPAGETK